MFWIDQSRKVHLCIKVHYQQWAIMTGSIGKRNSKIQKFCVEAGDQVWVLVMQTIGGYFFWGSFILSKTIMTNLFLNLTNAFFAFILRIKPDVASSSRLFNHGRDRGRQGQMRQWHQVVEWQVFTWLVVIPCWKIMCKDKYKSVPRRH